MTSGRDEYLERTKKHIDYDKENERRVWWLNNTGGDAANNLTVRDYFAAKAMQALLSRREWVYENLAEHAASVAVEMMKHRGIK